MTMTDEFDKLLAENPPSAADTAWAKAVLASVAAKQKALAVETFIAECFAGPAPDEWCAMQARDMR